MPYPEAPDPNPETYTPENYSGDPSTPASGDDETLSLARHAGYLPQLTPPTVGDPGLISQGPTKVSEGSKVSASSKGTNLDKFKQIGSVADPALQAGLKDADATANSMGQREFAPLEAAHTSGVKAVKGDVAAKVDYKLEEGVQAEFLRKINDDFGAEESRINEQYRNESNVSKADYVAALANLRASKVNPSQLWNNMGASGQFAVLTAAFVQDFLGAKGIHTSAMDTFNKAIDRNIDSQVQAIKTKGEVAEGFKSLWYMQRNQAASDQEARTRVRGFLLEGAKQAVISHMSQYEAGLATAQGQAAIAKLDDEFSKNLIQVYQHIDQNTVQLRQQAITAWGDKLKAANESVANSIAQQRLNMERDKKNPIANPAQDLVYDPETNKARWVFQPGIDPQEKVKLRAAQASAAEVNDGMNGLRELMRAGTVTPDIIQGTRFAGLGSQEYDAWATQMAHGLTKANGERATDQDVKDYMKGMKPDTWLNQADMEKNLAATQKRMLQGYYRQVQAVTWDLPGDDTRRGFEAAKGMPMEGSFIDAGKTANPPKQTTTELFRAAAEQRISGPAGEEPIPEDSVPSDVKKAHEEAKAARPDIWGNDMANSGDTYQFGTTREYERSMVRLRGLASEGDTRSKEMLQQLATPFLNGSRPDDPQAIYANIMLLDLAGSGPGKEKGYAMTPENVKNLNVTGQEAGTQGQAPSK